jgi:hypothetical protein
MSGTLKSVTPPQQFKNPNGKNAMTFIEAFNEEKKSWHWHKLPTGSEAMVMAFCFCLFLRMQGTSFEKMFTKDK